MTTSSPNSPLEDRYEWAIQIAREAGEVTLQHYADPRLVVERKADKSPVTAADRAAETLLRERIAERFPGDGIVGEEFGHTPGDSGFTWTLDPIDGTKSFIHGIPLYTTLVAVMTTPGKSAPPGKSGPDNTPAAGHSQIGVIRAPALGEEVYACRGAGCWYRRGDAEPQRAEVGAIESLSDSLFVTSEAATFNRGRSPGALYVYLELQDQARLARTWGDGYGYLMVATGRADLMIDPQLSLWDAAALQPVIEEAGGVFCDWQGQATIHTGDAIATNAALVKQVLALTRGR